MTKADTGTQKHEEILILSEPGLNIVLNQADILTK